jgi:hypothetical protein
VPLAEERADEARTRADRERTRADAAAARVTELEALRPYVRRYMLRVRSIAPPSN